MKTIIALLLPILLMGASASAQNKTAPSAPPAIVKVISGVTGKQFTPDTTFAALKEEDETFIAKEPVANWGLAQESGGMTYYNLVIGNRSYQLLVTKAPKAVHPTATLLRYETPQSKPEPIARGTLMTKEEEKPK
ncbi:hypothetical protein [Larkinella soli]|uniref:hypothetical protein n=1 Tax=Larkinella soli TaxID=1770527 RepID=UPI000FFBCEDF|nr:hypothetical protein [Larkinella soli]